MPLTLTGRLDPCLLLSYRAPAATVRDLVPRGLEAVTREGWAFWNIVACRIAGLRPAVLPAWAGIGYAHVAYRLLVRARAADGTMIEGLYFVRSDADSRLVSVAGNAPTDFRFHHADITLRAGVDAFALDVRGTDGGRADARVRVRTGPPARRDPRSPFASDADAAAFLKYRPLGLAPDPAGRKLRLAEVARDETRWREEPLTVTEAWWGFFETPGLRDAALERAVAVAAIDYRWTLGRRLAV